MTDKIDLKIGDLIQAKPFKTNAMFAHCVLTVDEITETGCFAYVQHFGRDNRPGRRTTGEFDWGDFEVVGHAKWALFDSKVETQPEPGLRRLSIELARQLEHGKAEVESILAQLGYAPITPKAEPNDAEPQ